MLLDPNVQYNPNTDHPCSTEPVSDIFRLLDELKEYGETLNQLIMNNGEYALSKPNDEYYLGKIDAYKLSYSMLVRLLERVNSYKSRVGG